MLIALLAKVASKDICNRIEQRTCHAATTDNEQCDSDAAADDVIVTINMIIISAD